MKTVTGRILLIPQGSRLIGDYNADVSFGQASGAARMEPADPARWPFGRS